MRTRARRNTPPVLAALFDVLPVSACIFSINSLRLICSPSALGCSCRKVILSSLSSAAGNCLRNTLLSSCLVHVLFRCDNATAEAASWKGLSTARGLCHTLRSFLRLQGWHRICVSIEHVRDLRIPSLTRSAGVQRPPCSAFRRRITVLSPGMTFFLPLPSGQPRPLKSSLPCYLPQRPELVCGLFPGSGQALLDFTWISGHTWHTTFVRTVAVGRLRPPGLRSGNRSETGPARLSDFRPLEGVRGPSALLQVTSPRPR